MELRISDAIGCDTQMPSSVNANLLHDGIVDTFVSVGATSQFAWSFIEPSGYRQAEWRSPSLAESQPFTAVLHQATRKAILRAFGAHGNRTFGKRGSYQVRVISTYEWPDELELFIVIAVLLAATCNEILRAFCGLGNRWRLLWR
jgi:hypothetical protein